MEQNDVTLSGEKLCKNLPRSYSPKRIEESAKEDQCLDFGLENSEDIPGLSDEYVCYFNRQSTTALGYKSPVPYKNRSSKIMVFRICFCLTDAPDL